MGCGEIMCIEGQRYKSDACSGVNKGSQTSQTQRLWKLIFEELLYKRGELETDAFPLSQSPTSALGRAGARMQKRVAGLLTLVQAGEGKRCAWAKGLCWSHAPCEVCTIKWTASHHLRRVTRN